jgi:hypothetical protein
MRQFKWIEWNVQKIDAHAFFSAFYVEWHLREALAPVLFDDHDREAAETLRTSVVAPAERSPGAKHKDHTKHTADGLPVDSLRTLLSDLGTLTTNLLRLRGTDSQFHQLTQATDVQRRVFELLDITP